MSIMTRDPEKQARAFLASMPAEYRLAFDGDAARAHASIAGRRGTRTTHVEIWHDLPQKKEVAICVVADDRPGLLSCISAALVAQRIDVVRAQAFCREREDKTIEAFDVLWVRRLPAAGAPRTPITDADIAALTAEIDRASQDATSGRVASPSSAPAHGAEAARTPRSSARIRFETDPKTSGLVLMVEAVDRPGLLLAVTQALFQAGLQIVALHATTEGDAAIERFHLAELDGSAVRRERLLTLQIGILGALDEARVAAARAG